ncbi:MAG: FHA domain-containing protein [Coriobacteriia bacterium]|nr:FHA domain-containing protein [Coriobacteriia bacterium]
MAKTTPIGVLYSVLSEMTGSKRYEDFDYRLISREVPAGADRSPYDRVTQVKSFRTREIIQKDPRQLSPNTFTSPYKAACNLISYLKRANFTIPELTESFSGRYSDNMVQALSDWNYNHHLYRNMMQDILRANETPTVTATAVLMLFLATAFNGDPTQAVAVYEAEAKKNGLFLRAKTFFDQDEPLEEDFTQQGLAPLALQRRYKDGSIGKTYLLSESDEGTIIGRTQSKGFVINDVEENVSRSHLRIWCEDSYWFAQGQGSTNGSWIIRPDGSRETIEEPSKTRPASALPPVVEIQLGDTLKLGTSTFFNVVSLKR